MPRSQKIRAWLTLVRPPNLFTVPGDPLVGLCLSGIAPGWNWLWPTLAALLLYMAGLVLNDVADVEIDRRERPERPLPQGAVAMRQARAAGYLLAALGLICASATGANSLILGMALLVAILTYTFITPRGSWAGIAVMGLCRSLSVLLGAGAGVPLAHFSPSLLSAAATIGAYITAVSLIAKDEAHATKLDLRRWLPAVLAAGGLAITGANHGALFSTRLYLLLALAAVIKIGVETHRLGSVPQPGTIPRAIGAYIRSLLLIQAAFCVSIVGGLFVAAVLILLQPLAARTAKYFYAS